MSKQSKKMYTYVYRGPVMLFDNCIEQSYTAETWAPTMAKARSNITYNYKKDNDYAPNAKITLPGEFIIFDPEDYDV